MTAILSGSNEDGEPAMDGVVIGGVRGPVLVGNKFSLKTMFDHDLNRIRCLARWMRLFPKLKKERFCLCSAQIAVAAALFSMAGCNAPLARPAFPAAARPETESHAVGSEKGALETRQQPASDLGSIPVQADREVRMESTPQPESPLEVGKFAIQIESLPSDAMIVVNGVPSGRTPKRILLAGTSQGFARERTSIKVRFLALQPDNQSVTVEDQLTPLDRIPAGLIFTPNGVQRHW